MTNILNPPSLLNSFLLVYFYELEKKLNTTSTSLKDVKFESEEANTDEFLKIFFKDFILVNNNIENSTLKKLVIKTDSEENTVNISEILNFRIINVFLPKELTPELKQQINSSKQSVYTKPDLYLEISDGKNTFHESVELKSTKNDSIPGSSIQQVSPFEYVIFVQRKNEEICVTTGFYLNSITNRLPFPDRSPRPEIGFKTLTNWNKKHGQENDNILNIETTSEENQDKINLLDDWQNFLADEWLEVIKNNHIKKGEKWFNKTLRKFAIKFLDYTESITDDEKIALKQKLIKFNKND